MGGGGGSSGGTDIQELRPSDIQPFYKFQTQQFGNYVQNQPLLKGAQEDALSYRSGLPDMLKQAQGYNASLDSSQKYYQDIADSGGKLSSQMLRNVDQGSLTGMSDTHSLGAQGTELLNRDQYTEQRMQTATTNLSGLAAERTGLLGSQQGMQSTGLNQLTGVQGAETGTFTQLMNPILQVPLANLQARIAQAQIDEQAQQSAQAGKGGMVSAGGSIAGAAIGAVGIAL